MSKRTLAMGVAPVALAALLAGCGQGADSGMSADDRSAAAELTVTVRPKPNAEARQWTLTCQPAGGTHPDPKAACKALSQAKRPFSPPKKEPCTMIYGGPQEATIRGMWHGKDVSANYARSDGCSLNQWRKLEAVLRIPR